ncbi:hypothetical protein CVT26_000411, partial [Gymnopilus dilepis]
MTRLQFTSNEQYYLVNDDWTELSFLLSKKLLERPQFDIARWFAVRLDCLWVPWRLRVPKEIYKPRIPIGDPRGAVAELLLADGINAYYPCIQDDFDPEARFYVHLKDFGSAFYVIEDADLDIQTDISIELLDNPKLDLVNWYQCRIKEAYLQSSSIIVKSWDSDYVKRRRAASPIVISDSDSDSDDEDWETISDIPGLEPIT